MSNQNPNFSHFKEYVEERKSFLSSQLFILRPKFKEYSQKTFKLQRRIELLERELKRLESISEFNLFE